MSELTEVNVKEKALSVEEQAKAVQVTNNVEYETAAEMLKSIKSAKKQVNDYWEEPIKKANEAHKALTSKRKEMTDICDAAEKILKRKMITYSQKIEAERRAAEEEARKKAQEEADKLIEQAAKSEEQGDTMTANVQMAQAEMVTQITPKIEVQKPKVAGISTRTKTVVKIIDDKQVPAYFNGFCIRTVDEKAILALHKLNPGLEIPGIKFEKQKTLAVR